jgi:hypothetical protein
VRRIAAGVIAIVLLALAGVFTLWGIGSHEMAAACARVGLVMGALWLALPKEGRRVNWWLVGLGLVVALVFARVPRPVKLIAVGALPLLVALFWPFRKRNADP